MPMTAERIDAEMSINLRDFENINVVFFLGEEGVVECEVNSVYCLSMVKLMYKVMKPFVKFVRLTANVDDWELDNTICEDFLVELL